MSWFQQKAGYRFTWFRKDGAQVRWNDGSPHPNPADPNARMYVAHEPGVGGKTVSSGRKGAKQVKWTWPRRWKTPQAAMRFMDREYPIRRHACQHYRSQRDTGPRIPVVHGTFATEICVNCGAWRTVSHSPGKWQRKPFPTKDDA